LQEHDGDASISGNVSRIRDRRKHAAVASRAPRSARARTRAATSGEQPLPVGARGADPLVSAFAIRAEGLGKRYRIGEREHYRAVRDTLTDMLTAPVRRLRSGRGASSPTTIWALRDVSLEVAPGDVLGVIGHNGAGKSTLLKILSRIAEPSEGQAELHGRVG